MYLLKTLRPAAPVLDPTRFLARALDASVDEPARVAALRHLHALEPQAPALSPSSSHALRASLASLSAALVPLLNEPLTWLPLEALSLVALWGQRVMLGVKHGRFVVSPTQPGRFVVDADRAIWCPTVGRVVPLRRIRELAHLVVTRAHWL